LTFQDFYLRPVYTFFIVYLDHSEVVLWMKPNIDNLEQMTLAMSGIDEFSIIYDVLVGD
jgi:hypothetical protein